MHGIREAIGRTNAQACVTGTGSMFRVHMKPTAPLDYRQQFLSADEAKRLKVLLDHLFQEGFLMINTCSATLSTPMTEVEIDALVDAVEGGLRRIASMN